MAPAVIVFLLVIARLCPMNLRRTEACEQLGNGVEVNLPDENPHRLLADRNAGRRHRQSAPRHAITSIVNATRRFHESAS